MTVRTLAIRVAFLLSVPLSLGLQAGDATTVVMISVDGLMPAAYRGPGAPLAPTIAAMAREGAYADGLVGVLPTVTYASHTTLITGVPPALHGIYGNEILDPDRRSNGAWYWYARDIGVPTLITAARGRGMTTAAISWPVSVGMTAEHLVPEFWRSGSSHPADEGVIDALSTRGLLDAFETSRQAPVPWPMSDAHRTELAIYLLRTHHPRLLLLHLTALDTAQHGAGPGSARAAEVTAEMDGYVRQVRDAVAQDPGGASTHIVIVSDHGFAPAERQLQPNALLKREGLLDVDAAGRVTGWQAYYHAEGGAGFVHLKQPSDTALVARVRGLLTTLQADPGNGIASIWSRDDLDHLGADPRASFGIGMRPGFYTGGGHDALVAASRNRGGHGFDPALPALHASLVVTGPAARGRGSLGVVRMTQVAPTVAHLLGLTLDSRADVPLTLSTARPAPR